MDYVDIFRCRNYIFVKSINEHIVLMKDEKEGLVILFNCDAILSINNIKIYIKIMDELKIRHGIIIYDIKYTPSTKKIIETCGFDIEIFLKKELNYNITQHKYYFPHEKVSETLKKELLQKYGKNLPIILYTDPVVKLFNFKKDDILRITRKENIIQYRIVK